MKTKISQNQKQYVSLQYTIDGGDVYREFMVPEDGGYVVELVNDGWSLVCEGLSHRGSTIRSTRDDLLACIRREWARCRRELSEGHEIG